MRFLDELEEAIGTLLAIAVQEDSLVLSMDWGKFAVHYRSTRSLQTTRRQLKSHVGRKVAIFLDNNSTQALRIRPATLSSKPRKED